MNCTRLFLNLYHLRKIIFLLFFPFTKCTELSSLFRLSELLPLLCLLLCFLPTICKGKLISHHYLHCRRRRRRRRRRFAFTNISSSIGETSLAVEGCFKIWYRLNQNGAQHLQTVTKSRLVI